MCITAASAGQRNENWSRFALISEPGGKKSPDSQFICLQLTAGFILSTHDSRLLRCINRMKTLATAGTIPSRLSLVASSPKGNTQHPWNVMVYIGAKNKSVSEHLSRRFLTVAGVGFLADGWFDL